MYPPTFLSKGLTSTWSPLAPLIPVTSLGTKRGPSKDCALGYFSSLQASEEPSGSRLARAKASTDRVSSHWVSPQRPWIQWNIGPIEAENVMSSGKELVVCQTKDGIIGKTPHAHMPHPWPQVMHRVLLTSATALPRSAWLLQSKIFAISRNLESKFTTN
jgi:hypothetical protein